MRELRFGFTYELVCYIYMYSLLTQSVVNVLCATEHGEEHGEKNPVDCMDKAQANGCALSIQVLF